MPPKAPKTVLDKIVVAIRAMRDHKGSSRQAIAKYLKSEFDVDNATSLKGALKKGVSSGVLTQDKQSFLVSGDAPIKEPEEEKMEVIDEKVGDGDGAAPGDTVTVAYVGMLASTGVQFDAAKKFTFSLGNGDVIKGWDRGLLGMAVGGKRRLTVPPKLAYGRKGCSPDIPPDSALNFLVTMKAID